MKKITYNKQFIDKDDVNIISQAVKSDLITSGNYVKTLESKLCKFLKVKFATTCINGTAGLDIAFQSINLSKKDNIIMPVVNFIMVIGHEGGNGLALALISTIIIAVLSWFIVERPILKVKRNQLRKNY